MEVLNKEKKVFISIDGKQSVPDELPQLLEMRTDGLLRDNGGSISFFYEESAVTGMEGVHTEFEVAPDRILLKRTGNVNSCMEFLRGKRTESLYDTGTGALLIGINSHVVRSDLSMEGGSLDLNYLVEIEHEPISVNEYHITVAAAE